MLEFLRACLGWGLIITPGVIGTLLVVSAFSDPRGGRDGGVFIVPLVGCVTIIFVVGGSVILFPPTNINEMFGAPISYALHPAAIFVGVLPLLALISLFGYVCYQADKNYKAGKGLQ